MLESGVRWHQVRRQFGQAARSGRDHGKLTGAVELMCGSQEIVVNGIKVVF